MRFARPVIALAFASIAAGAIAQPFAPGEIVVAGRRISDNEGVINVFRPDGTFSRTIPNTNFGWDDVAFNRAGQLYASQVSSVFLYDQNSAFVRILQTVPDPMVRSMAFARDGRVYILRGSSQVHVLSPTDALLAQHDFVGVTLNAIDLAADQCTLYFVGHTTVALGDRDVLARVNLCVSGPHAPTILHEFPPGSFPIAVRILPDGALLVGFQSAVLPVQLFDAAGTLIRTYTVTGNNLALAPDGRSFWAGAVGFGLVLGARIARVDIATGAVLQTIDSGSIVSGIAVFGDPRAAAADETPAVPFLDLRAMLILAALLVITAVLRVG
jgi:hypothetical protein